MVLSNLDLGLLDFWEKHFAHLPIEQLSPKTSLSPEFKRAMDDIEDGLIQPILMMSLGSNLKSAFGPSAAGHRTSQDRFAWPEDIAERNLPDVELRSRKHHRHVTYG